MEFNLAGYLKKFENFLPFETRVKNTVIEAIRDVTHITLERSKIAVSGSSVFVSGSSSLRSEIAMRQVKILARMKELQPTITITRIQ